MAFCYFSAMLLRIRIPIILMVGRIRFKSHRYLRAIDINYP